jgi:signal transduction histidine kinase/ActR/RegA family two-component response regulator/HPt (histidine-containing phosphotransfer) domain-containing protein
MVPEIATFKLSNEDKELNRDNKLIKAIQIMNDVRYDDDKKNIMEPIAKFQRIMNSRLESELESARKGTTRATVLQVVLAFVIILAIAILIRMLFMQVTFPIRNYTLMLRDFSFDNEGFSLTPQGTMELRMLAKNFNDLYESFQGELVRRRSAEETMKAAKDDADYANKAKSEFLANMSHEIRTPLNSVIGYQYLLKNTRLLPKQMEYSENIGMAAKNLLDIINEILDFSKIEAGRMILDEVDFNLDSMLKELCIIVGMEAKRKGIDLEFHINPDVPRFLRGDITRLKQVILNLLSNGIKFTHKGSIFIGVELYEKEKKHAFIKLHVTDTGIGISDEQKKSLFRVFTQGDASTSRKYGGTGLGLAICKRIVELMGGEISVESQVGIGSRFSFTVKLEIVDSISQSNEGINPGITAELFKNKRILLVEDSAINLQMTKEILENMGIETDTADSGPEAIRKVGRNKYEAVLMDIRMPGMDGYEATKRIRESEGKDSVPIVALTADAVEGVAQKAREAGMDGYLTKPLEPIRLLEILTGIMLDGEKEHNEGHYGYKTDKYDVNNDSISKNNISNYNSVDYEGAIRRIGGKEHKYIGILKSFIENHNADEVKIKGFISAGKIQELKEFVHALKGSAANIGALSLKDKLVNLENELFNGNEDEVQRFVNDFEIEIKGIYEWAVQYIESFDARTCRSKEDMGRIDLSDIREDLDILHKLLDMGDSAAKRLFEERMGYLSNILKTEDYNELRKQIISYSFQEAAVSVDRAIDRIEGRKI